MFCDQAINRSEFESRSSQRYKMSKLNPSIFDDALIVDRFKQVLSRDIAAERVHLEDLGETELLQNIQYLRISLFVHSKQSYLECVDAILLVFECVCLPVLQDWIQEMDEFARGTAAHSPKHVL